MFSSIFSFRVVIIHAEYQVTLNLRLILSLIHGRSSDPPCKDPSRVPDTITSLTIRCWQKLIQRLPSLRLPRDKIVSRGYTLGNNRGYSTDGFCNANPPRAGPAVPHFYFLRSLSRSSPVGSRDLRIPSCGRVARTFLVSFNGNLVDRLGTRTI